MSSSKKAAKDAQWLKYKPMIQRMIVDDKSQEEIRQNLEDNSFRVTKSQLEYKLKIWDIRKRLPKTRSEAFWQYTDARLLKREAEGKSSEVIIDGKIVNSAKVRKERIRNQKSTLARYTQPIQTPQTPEGMRISICTPPPMPMQFSWPKSLPWLQFETKLLEILHYPAARTSKRNTTQQSAKPLKPAFLRSLGLSNANSEKNVALLAAELGSIMPETQEGDNINRAQLILQGSSNETSHEYVKTMLYRLSNNFDDRKMNRSEDIHAWNQSLELLQTSGITSIPVQLGETTDVTVAAVVEKLFRSCLRVLIYYERTGTVPLQQTRKLTAWLLASGHNPNSKLMIDGELMTPIQAAVNNQLYGLAQQLLESGTEGLSSPKVSKHVLFDVLGGLGDCLNEWSVTQDVAEAMKQEAQGLVKCLIDMGTSPNELLGDDEPSVLMIAVDCRSIHLVEILVQTGADLLHRSRCDKHGLSWFTETQGVLGCAAGIWSQRAALDMVRYLIEQVQLLYPSKPLVDFITADAIFSAAINGYNEILILLHDHGSNISAAEHRGFSALHCAAYMGHLDTCKLLLEHGAFVDGPHCSRQPPSPLVLASLGQRPEVVKLLHQHGADLNLGVFIKTEDDWCSYFPHRNRIPYLDITGACSSLFLLNPVAAAILALRSKEHVYQYVIQHLVRHGGTLPEWAVYAGAAYNDPALVELALASPNASPNWLGHDGRTCLQVALDPYYGRDEPNPKGRCADIATALLKAGAVLVGGELQQAVLLESRSLVEEITQRDPGGFAKQQSSMSVLETAFLTCSSVMVEWALARDPHAYTPGLLCAAVLFTVEHQNLDILRRLLRNRQHSNEETPLESLTLGIAAYYNKPEILDILCTILQVPMLVSMPTESNWHHGVSTRWKPRRGDRPFWSGGEHAFVDVSPLSMALGSPQCLEDLLGRGCCPDEYTILRAVEHGDLEVLKRLVVMPRLKLCQAWVREVPLVLAVKKENLSMAAVFLNAGEDVNETFNLSYGRSPLQAAVECGNLDMINLLRKAGSDVNYFLCKRSMSSPLQAAVERGNLDIINLLLQAGADVKENPCGYFGHNPLQAAVERGNLDIINLLLKAGADVNKTPYERFRRSPLQAAVERGNLDMINLFLEEDADVNGPAFNEGGATALQLAAIQGFLGIAKTLIDRDADVNAFRAKTYGRTALEGAAEHGRIDMIHFLLDQGARTDGDGQVQYLRAIKLAEEEGHLVAAKMLRGYRDWTADDHRLWDRLQNLQEKYLKERRGYWWDSAQEKDFADEVHSGSDSEEVDYEETSSDASEEDLKLPDAEDEVTLSEDTQAIL